MLFQHTSQKDTSSKLSVRATAAVGKECGQCYKLENFPVCVVACLMIEFTSKGLHRCKLKRSLSRALSFIPIHVHDIVQ